MLKFIKYNFYDVFLHVNVFFEPVSSNTAE